MSTSVQFHVLTAEWLQPGEQHPQVTMHHYGDSSEVVAQCFGSERTIKSHKLPQQCWLYDSEPSAETTKKRTGSGDVPLRYATARQVAKLKLPKWVGPFDHAMMAYFKRLAKDRPNTIVILELF